jgi:deoxycytidine triphosphate deaminase
MSDIPPTDEWKYEDPYPDEHGILLSNRIHELCERRLLISGHYQKQNLRPASYTLRIGEDYIDSEGNLRRFTDDEDSFVFEKNSIVFVTIKEEFDLPYYIIARFNLRVNWVYDGVLLGTGPQVDPGFTGYLSCPLYNLTNADITIKHAQNFATIDFEKTTSLLANMSLEEKTKLIDGALDKRLAPVGDQLYSFYRASALKPLEHRKAHRMVSSLIEMREEVRTWRRLGIGSALAFFGLTLSLLAFGSNIYRQNNEVVRQNTDFSREMNERKNELEAAKQKISALRADLDRLESSFKQMPTSAGQTKATKGAKKPD